MTEGEAHPFCPECNSAVSTSAESCPNCGKPLKKPVVTDLPDLPNKQKVMGIFTKWDDYDKKFAKKYFIRWIILFAIGCLIVTVYFQGDNVALVRAPSAVMNKYLYELVASAIIALLSLRK